MESRSQNGLRHSSVVRMEKRRARGVGVEGEKRMQHPAKLIDASV